MSRNERAPDEVDVSQQPRWTQAAEILAASTRIGNLLPGSHRERSSERRSERRRMMETLRL